MALRWSHGPNVWESMYYIGGGLSGGIALSAQFVALTACAPEDQQGTAIGLYYLSQQAGMMFGIASFAAIFEAVFRKALVQALRELPDRDEVSLLFLHAEQTLAH